MFSEKLDTSIAFLIYVGVVVSGIIAITVIAVPIVAPMVSDTYVIPGEIKEWGGVIIGFYFGSFITLVGSLLREKTGDKAAADTDKDAADKAAADKVGGG